MSQQSLCRKCGGRHVTRSRLARVALAVASRAFVASYAAESGEPEDQVERDTLPHALPVLRLKLRQHVREAYEAIYHGLFPYAGHDVALLAGHMVPAGAPLDFILEAYATVEVQMPVFLELAIICGRDITTQWYEEEASEIGASTGGG